MKYGAQLFSVRHSMEKDCEGTLRTLAELGYSAVEAAGFFGHSAKEVRDMADKYGLEITSTHTGFEALFNGFDNTVKFHKELGCSDIVIPWGAFFTAPEVENFIEQVNKCIPKLRAEGMRLHYHNHAGEFLPNQDGLVVMPEYISRTELMLEPDVYWLCVAGIDPVKFIEEHRNRISVVHLKDGKLFDPTKPYPANHSSVLGQGEVPIDAVREKAVELGLRIIVENEGAADVELDEMSQCIEYLKKFDN